MLVYDHLTTAKYRAVFRRQGKAPSSRAPPPGCAQKAIAPRLKAPAPYASEPRRRFPPLRRAHLPAPQRSLFPAPRAAASAPPPAMRPARTDVKNVPVPSSCESPSSSAGNGVSVARTDCASDKNPSASERSVLRRTLACDKSDCRSKIDAMRRSAAPIRCSMAARPPHKYAFRRLGR